MADFFAVRHSGGRYLKTRGCCISMLFGAVVWNAHATLLGVFCNRRDKLPGRPLGLAAAVAAHDQQLPVLLKQLARFRSISAGRSRSGAGRCFSRAISSSRFCRNCQPRSWPSACQLLAGRHPDNRMVSRDEAVGVCHLGKFAGTACARLFSIRVAKVAVAQTDASRPRPAQSGFSGAE
jgi:hypothetical protein